MNNFILNEIKIEVTQKCPLNCLHCSSEANISKTQELSLDQVISIINDSKKLGTNEVILSGGEPLIWSHLSQVLSFCKEIRMPVSVYTTGVPLLEHVSQLNELISVGLQKTVVSLYGSSQRTHEYITRVHGSFDLTICAIKEMVSKGINVGIHFVAMAPNCKELVSLTQLAQELGVHKISVLRFVPQGRGSIVRDIFSLNKSALNDLRKDIAEIRKNNPSITIRVGSPFNILLLNDDVFCLAAADRLIVGSDGKVSPCDAFKNLDFNGKMCSINEGNLIDIWYKSEYLTYIRREVGKGLGPTCQSCQARTKCKGGCLAQKILRLSNGGAQDPDPDCLRQR